jgi:hypothetical protein
VHPPLSTNDHCTISAVLSFKVKHSATYKRHVWIYTQANFDGMNQAISEYNWDACFDDDNVDEACNRWTTSYLNIARMFIPNRIAEIRPHDIPWYNSKLRKLKRTKDRLHNIAKSSKSTTDWENFRTARNLYTKSLCECEQEYKEKLADSLKTCKLLNPKHWWHITKQFMGKVKDCILPPMIKDGKTYFGDKEKANGFNEAFLSFSKLNITDADLPDVDFKTDKRLDNIPVTEQDVTSMLKSLDTSKATGPDGISAKMLKETAVATTPSLTRLIKLSLEENKVPKAWKQANVFPIYKKGDQSDFANYRPVSLLPVVAKVCEKLVFKHVFNYLKVNKIISVHQSGFTPGDSTVNQLVYLYDLFCKALNDKKDVRIVFCDQSKAFDRVWHHGLLFKLKGIGITGSLFDWFTDYLNQRKQRISIMGVFSEWGNIEAGVPQGSVLGPLLFLIYINDITENIKSGIKLFADDTSLFVMIDNNINEATTQLNTDLETLKQWASTWLVSFNPKKTKSMYVTLKRNVNVIPLTFDGQVLENVPHHKHLGLELNSTLTWKDHIDPVTANASKKLNLLAHLKHLLDRKTLLTMYLSFIRPTLEYANIVWCNCTELENDRLEAIQRRAARIISGGIIRTPTKCLYDEIGIEPLKARQDRNVLLMFHKMVHNNAPTYLVDLVPTTTRQRQRYNLRRETNFTVPKCRITKYQNSFLPFAIKQWNDLNESIKGENDYDKFKNALESCIPQSNPLYEIGSRKETIIMARLRMNCSDLRSNLCDLNIIDSPRCSCGFDKEDIFHYFFTCPLYNGPRAALHNKIANLAPFTTRTLLFGKPELTPTQNKQIYMATLEFIRKSK